MVDVPYGPAQAGLVVELVSAVDWKRVRDLRLEALTKDRESFLPGSLEVEERAADAYWVDGFRDGTWVVARWGDRDVGLAHLRPEGPGSLVWHVENVWVDDAFRRRGVASEMMSRLIGRAPRNSIIRLWIMEDNVEARSLYTEGFDFKPTDERQATREAGKFEVRLELGPRASDAGGDDVPRRLASVRPTPSHR